MKQPRGRPPAENAPPEGKANGPGRIVVAMLVEA
jgi:hypothetical protein